MINSDEMKDLVNKYVEFCADAGQIDQRLYSQYDVKRGLRESNGKGVLTGLTRISEINATKTVNGVTEPADGELFYRGINVKDLIAGQPDGLYRHVSVCAHFISVSRRFYHIDRADSLFYE